MYIDETKKIIFIHIPRTGGTRIKSCLNLHDKIVNSPPSPLDYHRHIRKLDTIYKEYFKFTFVRNPWDRFVSLYFYNKSKTYQEMFPDRLTTLVAKKYEFKSWLDNFPYRTLQQVDFGTSELDFVGKYETIQSDFNSIFNGNLNVENSIDRKHYSYYYDDVSIDKVYALANNDIKEFKYKYEM